MINHLPCDSPRLQFNERRPGHLQGLAGTPLIHFLPDSVDDGRVIVLLVRGGKPFTFVEYNDTWSPAPLRFLGFGIGVINSARQRASMIFWVGWPLGSNSQ